jgi:hypothetical protein
MLSKWLNSLKIYSLSVIGVHVLIITFFFPWLVFYIIIVPSVFVVFYMWCDLVHQIEEANRIEILNLLHTTTCPNTKDILAYELYLHDENSLAGHRPFNNHGI